MSVVNAKRILEAVDGLCAAIDAGEVVPGEREMLAVAMLVKQHAPPFLKHDLLCKLASRCKEGQAVLRRQAQ